MAETLTAPKAQRSRKASTGRKETFSLKAPGARQVLLAGDFTDWDKGAVPMKADRDGVWRATVTISPGTYQFRYKVDGEWRNDPECLQRQLNAFGGENCVREVK